MMKKTHCKLDFLPDDDSGILSLPPIYNLVISDNRLSEPRCNFDNTRSCLSYCRKKKKTRKKKGFYPYGLDFYFAV